MARLFNRLSSGGGFSAQTLFLCGLGAGGSFCLALFAFFDLVFFALALAVFFAGLFIFGTLGGIVSLARFGGAQPTLNVL